MTVDSSGVGFGTFLIPPEVTSRHVLDAIDAGYRLIDTAAAYGNEAGVGQAIRDSGVSREDIKVTTKLANEVQHNATSVSAALEDSLREMGTDYVDLYLIHWPLPDLARYESTWVQMLELREKGLAREVGVSNFTPRQLCRLKDSTGVMPSVNQVELHPHLQQHDLLTFHEANGIRTQAWSPLGGSGAPVLSDAVLIRIADRLARTPAQVVLKWHLQRDSVPLPRSTRQDRATENRDLSEFTLSPEDLASIRELDLGRRVGPDPETFHD